ncbi:glycoside hydrolase family 108 protein [Mesorhizobium sp. B2-1-2]|uniref:glycoside hydrolase family 108 protein n=1 Tax=Mesorhizobium sp. B2-1-2 TaxID=2589973 RepID=UPI00112B13A9|nr:glycoside hydrolase family 108 protein [Mesorhizobium sp. B2-1-2]TPN11740.1 N-acetylmuramidase [Mesorhizobium sp. B2-1-2]
MAVSRERASLDKLLVHEGGYVNHPSDPGGPTNKGVTQRVYDAYRKGKGQRARSVKSITMDEVYEIYDRQYWDAVKGDQLPDGVDYVVLDGAVNSGVRQSVMWLQRALGAAYKGRIDGSMGFSTLEALKTVNNHDALVDRICDIRLNFLRHLKTWPVFGKGWAARVSEVRSIGKAWASGEKPQIASFMDGGQAKGFIEDANTAPGNGVADAATGAGIGGGGLAGTLQGLQDQLTPLSYSSEWITKVVVVLSLVSALMLAGGIGWRWYATRKAARLAQALGTG